MILNHTRKQKVAGQTLISKPIVAIAKIDMGMANIFSRRTELTSQKMTCSEKLWKVQQQKLASAITILTYITMVHETSLSKLVINTPRMLSNQR